MTINPKIGMWLCIIAAIISALVAIPTTFTDIFGPDNAKVVLGVLGLLNTITNAVNAVLHAIPSVSGPAGAAEFPLGPKPGDEK